MRYRWFKPFHAAVTLAVVSVMASWVAFALGLVYVCSDDLTRIYWALNWWQDPFIIRVSYWLPGHSALLGPILAWSGHPLLAAHALNGLLCGISVVQCFFVARRLLRDESTALLATALFSFLPMRIWISFSTLVEPLFTVYFLAWIGFVAQWLEERDSRPLAYACVMSFLMGVTRQQGWVLSGLLAALVLWRERSLRSWLFALVALAAPLFIAAYSYLDYGDALYMIHTYAADSKQYYQGRQPNFLGLKTFATLYALEALFLALGAAGWRRLNRRTRVVWAVAVAFFALEVASVWNQMPTVLAERVVYFSGMFACFAAAAIAIRIFRSGSPVWRKAVLAAAAVGFAVQGGSLARLRPWTIAPTLIPTAKTLSRSDRWMRALESGSIATDQDPLMVYGMELIHNRVGTYNAVDLKDGKLLVRSPRPPTTYLIEREDVRSRMEKTFPTIPRIRLGAYEIFSSDPALIEEIRLSP